MNRTIKKSLSNRLLAQAKEAELQGLNKVGLHLKELINNIPKRDNDEMYFYTFANLEKDVENSLWNATLRIADYFDKNVDAAYIQEMIEKLSTTLIEEMRIHTGSIGIGPHEPGLPGQDLKKVAIEVEDDE